MGDGTTRAEFRPGNVHGLLLYDHASSPCARRVRISLLEKGLVWDTCTIDLSRLEQRSPEYLKLNPNGFVPTLAHGERVVYESNVITRYLDDAFGEPALYPDDPAELAEVQAWQAAELAMAKDYRPLMYQRLLGPVVRLMRSLDEALAAARRSTHDAADLAWEERVWRLEVLTPEEEQAHVGRLETWLERLESALGGREWLVGGRFGQAEISVYPRVMMYPFVGVPLPRERFPGLSRWMARLAARSSFARTLSPEDRGLVRLARTGVLGWLARTLRKPGEERTLSERARLAALRALLRRAMGGEAEGGVASAPRPLRMPAPGPIAQGAHPVRIRTARASGAPREPLVLFDARHSPHGRRLRIQLALAGVPFERREIDLARLEHRGASYRTIHPGGEVPALRHGGRTLVDSAVIAEYLDGALGVEPPLLPRDAWLAAQVRMWIALEAGTHKEFRPLFWLHVLRPEMLARGLDPLTVTSVIPEGVHPSHVAWLHDVLRGQPRFDTSEALARATIEKKVGVIEERLVGRDYLVGDALTLADVAWWTRLDLLPKLGVALAPARFPGVTAWHARLASRPGFVDGSARADG